MKLYIYDHCPFCIKARMVFGLKQVPVTLHMMLNDDVDTPTRMVGKKMVPILEKEDGTCMGESMDIVRYIDARYPMPSGEAQSVLAGSTRPEIAAWCQSASNAINALCMPRWIELAQHEFSTQSARAYFQHKKEAMIGPFAEAKANSTALIEQVNAHLVELAPRIASPNAVNGTLSEDDFTLFPLLRQLSVVKGVHYPVAVETYRREMAARTGVALQDDIAC